MSGQNRLKTLKLKKKKTQINYRTPGRKQRQVKLHQTKKGPA